MGKILFVGCGNMGGAIVSGMLTSGQFHRTDIIAILPEGSTDIQNIKDKYGIEVVANYPYQEQIETIIFAVKPQILDEICMVYQEVLKKQNNPDILIVSIAAGKTMKFFQNYFADYKIVRTMPNINAIVSKSITAGVASAPLTSDQRFLIEKIFNSIGKFFWIENEEDINGITAIAGSGPAYFYYFTECLAEAAINLGLSDEIAAQLAHEVFTGSAMLLENSDISPKDLRHNVTSPNGTTFAALERFKQNGEFQNIIIDAAEAAKARSIELSE